MNHEEKDNGKKGENRSTRDVRPVDTGKSNAGKSMLLQEHSEEPPYCLHLQSDGEGLEVPDDRDMDESSEGDKGRHGKRESSESQSCDDRVYTEGHFKNGANIARREKYESYGKVKKQETRANKTPQSGSEENYSAAQH